MPVIKMTLSAKPRIYTKNCLVAHMKKVRRSKARERIVGDGMFEIKAHV